MKKLVLGSLILLSAALQPGRAEDIRSLPAAVYGQMKSSSHLGKLWISPSWNGAQGFAVGKVQVAAEIDDPYNDVVAYLPYKLRTLSTPDSPNVLSVTVVELSWIERGPQGAYTATMGVEGQITDKDGKLLVAFRTRETDSLRETITKCFEMAMDQIAWSLSKDLGKAFTHALEVRHEVNKETNHSGIIMPPPAQAGPMDVQSRLLRLDDLLKKGLITPEEYKLHKAEILKNL